MADEKVKSEAMQIIGMFQVLPRLVVFDLDYTLWPFYCECRSKREMPSLYPHAKGILYALKDKGVDMAIASRSPTPDIATTFLDKLNIKSMFVAQGIQLPSANDSVAYRYKCYISSYKRVAAAAGCPLYELTHQKGLLATVVLHYFERMHVSVYPGNLFQLDTQNRTFPEDQFED
ncbi:unnamed protein product [Linum tenue]|uniref:Magnesium-dependent phosphatase 1 n=1 Tax=Linum tenue TaxID=586396 RepID=A0AAV0IUJ6_9ROSI|nr:unnamed protein product [Linum tenue]